ncbi:MULTISPECIES: hypothetical protein [unclassified Mesorhizobium]|uniref:hypothetical protein n=1 Tax=unclassified Mesorhizobium TaxID=325217 RepID=UPI00117CFB17|nr:MULTISPECIES: hypothetical protein [unclassified Mesorhizobium]
MNDRLFQSVRTFAWVITTWLSKIFALGRDDEHIARLASALAKSIGLGRKAAAPTPAAAEKPKRAARAVAATTTAHSSHPGESPQGTCQSLTGCI